MPEHDGLHERGRALEEDYFRKKDRELLEKMRQAAAADQTQRDLGAITGITDPEVLRDMASLGFTPETVSLLPLVPVLQVAWAERGISEAERYLIVKLARARGIAEQSAADRQLAEWLADPPGAAVFDGATRLIRAMLDAQPEGRRELEPSDLVRYCEQVADASGGFLGLRRISHEERALLASISEGLKGR
jgi:hypothetical protein